MQENWTTLIRPKGIEVDRNSLTPTYGKFSAKPLERGYGHTIGNGLRRVLLSSLQGCAIASVKFDGVLHEFATLNDVTEDMADIILNLKGVRCRLQDQGQKIVTIDKKGPCELTAGDLAVDSSVQILNPTHHVATLGKDAHIRGEILLKWGRGYVSADKQKQENSPIGTIAIDSVYSPVLRCNYSVANARVGSSTDYDRLNMELWTDGSLLPEQALAYAAKIMKEQVSIFINFDEEVEVVEVKKDTGKSDINENLFKSVEELELSVRSANCLQNANIRYIYELVQKTEAEMLRTKNFGRKSLNEIKDILQQMGLGLGLKLDLTPEMISERQRELKQEP
ncbi:DNA-directed RNA polymerase subunit alpha [bacterium]|nr:DNA-directed RNA polymerase subunit alpha [bacterium]